LSDLFSEQLLSEQLLSEQLLSEQLLSEQLLSEQLLSEQLLLKQNNYNKLLKQKTLELMLLGQKYPNKYIIQCKCISFYEQNNLLQDYITKKYNLIQQLCLQRER
jgi:hypothetical protein